LGGVAVAAAALGAWVGPGADSSPPATTPTPVPSPTESAPDARGRLETLLLALPREASLDSARRELRALWGPGPLEELAFRTHLEHLRRLDTPVALEMFHPARRDTCFLALVGLRDDTAVLRAGSGVPLRVPLGAVERLWTRQALALWRDFDGLGASPQDALRAAFTRDTLARLGYPAGADPSAAVARFQADFDLAPDGVVGARTLLLLYGLGRRGGPRLGGGTS
jgi:hypothetical protein